MTVYAKLRRERDTALAERDELRKALNEAITLVGMLSSFAACGENLDAEDLTRVQKFVDTARLALRDKE